ncbi:MAG: hypothetical protein E7Z72_02005 [Methanocorpusculum parvum]|nr:hypothetical protein [Methanocorpusculum parvum]
METINYPHQDLIHVRLGKGEAKITLREKRISNHIIKKKRVEAKNLSSLFFHLRDKTSTLLPGDDFKPLTSSQKSFS